ncbi:hypothetical protein FA15DRAFT_759121 [Coprinopsis marcescibilis]|uniref:Fruit-body specific protein a n=1 Tax=Coprinopsis marcescibilis TaxID=230819 RepID=A0A5C3KKE6_COPMA|nr:hypothetical protein FA15DRAFT_759121 [Coprinopsis marcescibilis]
MIPVTRLLSLASLAVLASSSIIVRQNNIVPPGAQGTPFSVAGSHPSHTTDFDAIANAALTVDQKGSPAIDEVPNQLPTDIVPAVRRRSERRHHRPAVHNHQRRPRGVEDYIQVFDGTGTGPDDRDASIHGTAYLTYSLVNNATYNVEACLDYCSSVKGCVFANLYYEFNNYLLDFEASEQSNLKCAIYGDIHTAEEKTNFGGQKSYPTLAYLKCGHITPAPPPPLTYIQHSTGWALRDLVEPEVPEGYEYVFGPIDAANNANGYMGYTFLETYDVDVCATECNQRGADPVGGICKYFNIWRAVVDGIPTTYTCAMYFEATDASTAVNAGQGNLKVTYSRGYRRILAPVEPVDVIVDGSFEEYQCPGNGDFCFSESTTHWVGTSPPGGSQDATFFHFQSYAHTGTGVMLLGSATGADSLSGTIRPREPLATVAGRSYRITFWHSSAFSGPPLAAGARADVLWNGAVVHEIRGYQEWEEHTVDVVANGSDLLSFHGGASPAWSFIDDISVLEILP